jgi:hypothetical protein
VGGVVRPSGRTALSRKQFLPDEPKFSIDVALPFSKIDVAKLAAILGVSEAEGETIKTVKGSVGVEPAPLP